MNSTETLQAIEAKKMKPVDFIYLGIILLFFLMTAVLFFFSTGFIIESINKVFTTNGESTSQSLNIELYSAVEKKLNLPVNTKESITPESTPL